MSTDGWVRSVISTDTWTVGSHLLAQIPGGDTYLRTRFGWGFTGITPLTGSMMGVMQNLQVFGLVTTVGDGGGPPPNARTDSEDALPPTQRWLWWESRAPVPTSVDGSSGIVTWADSKIAEPTDAKAMVFAADIPDGQFLNLWASWAAAYDWPDDGQIQLWFWTAVLAREP